MPATDFTSLTEQAAACTLCEVLLPHDPRPVFQLRPDAKFLITGQAPGRKVHESSIPFDEARGDRLRVWMGGGHTRIIFLTLKKWLFYPWGLLSGYG